MVEIRKNRAHFILLFVFPSILTHALGQIQQTAAVSSSSSTESASSTQPIWSYQVKPNGYVNTPAGQQAHYTASPSIFDAFSGLSQRQGSLSSSPFLSILPIILIAAGGMLLLLPLLTMMIASPFSGGFGGYGNQFGYPQVGALNKKRSLADQFGQKGLVDLIEHVSTTIDELTRKYSNPSSTGQTQRRAKGLNSHLANEPQISPSTPTNHKPANGGETNGANNGGSNS